MDEVDVHGIFAITQVQVKQLRHYIHFVASEQSCKVLEDGLLRHVNIHQLQLLTKSLLQLSINLGQRVQASSSLRSRINSC